MLEPSRDKSPLGLPPSLLPTGTMQAAKWPPDDDDLGGASGGFPPGGDFSDPGDGDFKRGRFSPKMVLAGFALVAVGAVLAVFATKTESEKLSQDDIAAIKKNVFVLPKDESLAKWRELASSSEYQLQSEALTQLGFARDPEGVHFATQALSSIDHRVRGTAAQVLAHYGSPAADPAKDALHKALTEADASDMPQITWALVTLGDARVFDKAMDLYRQGHLPKVQRLGGGPAFDPELLAKLVSLETLAGLSSDTSDGIRQLVAIVLSRAADPKFADTLIQLVKDPVVDVAREAATGLGRLADDKSRGPLIDALAKADKDSRQKFLEALRDGIGGEGLALALPTITAEKFETRWHQYKQIFEMMRGGGEGRNWLVDARAGDELLKFIATKPHIHWETEAALRMAEAGDLRAVPFLARRMRLDPLTVYSETNDYERMARRDDSARVVAARMLADLAIVHPEAREEIRREAEDAMIGWLHDKPQPHANGLRFLAAAGSTKDIVSLRKWANPSVPLPKEGQQPPMASEWEIAQSAMRYVGWLQDPQSWSTLERGLKRRDPKLDVTMDSLMSGGLAMLGMTLRAINVGASDGFAQWGDTKAQPLLVTFIEEEKENEQGRFQGCVALPWVSTDEQMLDVVKKVHEFNQKDPKKQFIRGCYLEALIRRPVPGIASGLIEMLSKDTEPDVRHQVARAIGLSGFDDKVAETLYARMADVDVRNDAALALILGGSSDQASRAVAMYADYAREALDELKDIYYRTFGYFSDDDFEKGRLYKWVANAEAISRVKVRDTPQEWARLRLQSQLENLDLDNGPRSMTRVVLRSRLLDAAKAGDSQTKQGAIATLKFMREQGALMALRGESGETGQLAKQAFFELMNPKYVDEAVPAKAAAN